MTLLDLDAEWLMFEGRRVGFIFRSPTDRTWWQTCFVEKFYGMKGRDGSYPSDDAWNAPDSQSGIIEACLPEAAERYQMCNPEHCWTVEGGIANASLSTITVTPSLDGSAGGLWHGFVTNGQIVGGV